MVGVILYHLNSLLVPGGFAGVDVFFVISGFVVSASIANLERKSTLSFLVDFYSRRALRILPALTLCLTTTMLISILLIPSAWLSHNINEVGLKAYFAISNFSLANMDGYFSPRTEFNPFTHTWSLAIEEQFYLIYPILIAIGVATKYRWLPVLVPSLLSLAIAWLIHDSYPQHSFYLLPTRYWELAAGIATFALHNSGYLEKARNTRAPRLLASLGVCTIITSFFVSSSSSFPAPGGLLPVAGTAITLIGLLYSAGPLNKALSSHFFVHLGKISYSLYLWHWPTFVVLKWTVGLESLKIQVLALLITYGLSSLSYYLVENPIRFNKYLISKAKWAHLSFGFSILILGFLSSLYLVRNQEHISWTRTFKESGKWHHQGIPPTNNGCHATTKRVSLHTSFLEVISNSCLIKPNNNIRIFAVGDSHLGHYNTLFQLLALNHGIEIYSYNNAGCPFGRLMEKTRNPLCLESEKAVIKSISELAKDGDIVFLSSLRLPRFTDQWIAFEQSQTEEQLFSKIARINRLEAEEEFKALILPLLKHNLKIVFIAPTFIIKDVTFRCVDWFNQNNPICKHKLSIKRSEIDRLREPVLQSFERISKLNKNISVFDPLPAICGPEICSALNINGDPILVDADHISPLANRMIEPFFIKFLSNLKKELDRKTAGEK